MSNVTIEGRWAVLRDSQGNIVEKTLNKHNEKENWRNLMKKMTNGGQLPFTVAIEIAQGTPFVPELPDGTRGEPQVPNASTRLVAAQWLHEQMFGKAVAQTEIVKAEEETKLQSQVAALSDAELQAKVFAYLEARGKEAHDIDPDPSDTES